MKSQHFLWSFLEALITAMVALAVYGAPLRLINGGYADWVEWVGFQETVLIMAVVAVLAVLVIRRLFERFRQPEGPVFTSKPVKELYNAARELRETAERSAGR